VGYRVELVKGARRIFAATTSTARLSLPNEWSYEGRRYRLVAGRYRWYVWPLYGRANARKAPGDRPIVAATLTIPS
jgi:hypothetical protein